MHPNSMVLTLVGAGEAAIEAIVHAARTGPAGQIGDGKIFVLSLEDCVRIRTGEGGSQAIGP